MAETEVHTVEDCPPPALKKRATKRGLSKLLSSDQGNNSDLPPCPPHNASVYSSCVSKLSFTASNLPRKPLFSKHSNTDDSEKPVTTDVQPTETRRPRRSASKTSTASLETPASILVIDDDFDEDENSIISTDDISIIRSPSPPAPPPPPRPVQRKAKRVSKGIRNAFKALDSMKGELRIGLQASPRCASSVGVEDSVESDVQVVRVKYITDIHRFSMMKTDMYYNLQVEMSQVLGVDVDQVGLYLNDTRLASSDTPLSTHLHLADIIVCHILVSKEDGGEEDSTSTADSVRVQIQCRSSRQKTVLHIKKFLPFGEMMKKYAEQHGKPVEKLQFYFDGELLLHDTMPNHVDIDDDDTIDVVELK